MKLKKQNVKRFVVLLTIALSFALLAGCNNNTSSSSAASGSSASTPETPVAETIKLIVGASPTPHAEILAQIVDDLAAEGIELEIREFTDYVLPNTALDGSEIDANYFQHQPYLDSFNEEHGTKIISLAPIHYEPFGLYPGKSKSLDDVKDGAKIAVPNDTTNEARALLLLQDLGWIKLKDGAGLTATKNDIAENAKKLDIVEIEAAQIPRSIQDVDFAIINGNYAIEAGFNVATDALTKEDKSSLAAQTYANIIAVREGDEGRPELNALVRALQSEKVKQFIETTYEGAVVPTF